MLCKAHLQGEDSTTRFDGSQPLKPGNFRTLAHATGEAAASASVPPRRGPFLGMNRYDRRGGGGSNVDPLQYDPFSLRPLQYGKQSGALLPRPICVRIDGDRTILQAK